MCIPVSTSYRWKNLGARVVVEVSVYHGRDISPKLGTIRVYYWDKYNVN